MKTWLVVALACAPVISHADDKSDAQALFDLGVREMKDGKLDEACKHLAASLSKLPDSGTRGALAVCTTKQGRIATAWTLWKELAVTAPTEAMKSSAAQAAAELEPRLPRYQLKDKPAVTGLVVKINGALVDLSLDVPLPVDPGKIAVTASAPDYQEWSGDADAREGQITQIEIPDLVPAPKPKPIDPPRPPPVAAKRNWTALGLVIGGGASIVVGSVFGLRAKSQWNDAEELCGDVDACPGDVFTAAKDKYSSARTSAIVSTVFVAAGAAAAIGGGVLWYLQRDKPAERTALIPTVTGDGVGLVVSGRFR
jgi:hypothetical protein